MPPICAPISQCTQRGKNDEATSDHPMNAISLSEESDHVGTRGHSKDRKYDQHFIRSSECSSPGWNSEALQCQEPKSGFQQPASSAAFPNPRKDSSKRSRRPAVCSLERVDSLQPDDFVHSVLGADSACSASWVDTKETSDNMTIVDSHFPSPSSADIQHNTRHKLGKLPFSRRSNKPTPRLSWVASTHGVAGCSARAVETADTLAEYEQCASPLGHFNDPNNLLESWMSANDLPIVTVAAAQYHTLDAPLVPAPTTQAQLVNRMLQFLFHRPLPHFSRIVKFHDRFRHLHSTRSYNLLIQHAIRHSSYGTAKRLLSRMRYRGIRQDTETQKLYVRWMIRAGYWRRAWHEVQSDIRDGMGQPPIEVWLEFLGYADVAAFRQGVRPAGSSTPSLLSGTKVPHELRKLPVHDKVPLSVYEEVVSALPMYNPFDVVHTSPRVMMLVVRTFLLQHRPNHARQLTMAWIKLLPKHLRRIHRIRSLEIIHSHLVFAPVSTASHFKTEKFVNKLCALHPQLQPNSTTLFLLLRTLKRTKNGGVLGKLLVHRFRKRWGPSVIDQRVRRRLAGLAVKEGLVSSAVRLVDVERRKKLERTTDDMKSLVGGGLQEALPERLLRPPTRKFLKRQSPEDRHWRWLRRRLSSRIRRGEAKRVPVIHNKN
ncbi:hypothetical protein BD410DRAFT_834601 [Rickenella mellea]|uniref:Uncharacterized protein n=1 Tax=Rickenella mellea TaxID=50990 RepID=A0A4Y7QNQ5_9AGAM|nr:hypothetical protein BD410DRAFT_834601 [Rickenella mellea]